MSQRISLTRIIAINWYGFRQIFDVDDNVLISGAFGTGKSALLDLIQYVMLGEHWKANRAAAGNKQGRDLVGYCLGDTNQTRNGQRHFLRPSGVTLVALEFSRPKEKGNASPKRETWGVRLGFTSPDAAPKQTYFCVPDRLDYTAIAPENRMLAEDEFRTWLRREYGNESLFNRQRDYLEEMAAPRHLNFDPAAFHRTFPKAIAFEIEDNVETFIREFILEESPLDVREVRSALRAYDDTRKRLEKQEDEANFLRRINQYHSECETHRRESLVLDHISHELKLLQAEERRERHEKMVQRLEKEHHRDLAHLDSFSAESAEVKKLLDEVRFEIQKDPDGGKINQLEHQKKDLQSQITLLSEARKTARQQLDDRHYRWLQWLKHGSALQLEGLAPLLKIDERLLGTLRSGTDLERFTSLPKLANLFNEIWTEVKELLQPLTQNITSSEKRLRQLAEDLDNLSKGQAPGSFPVFQAMQQKLGQRVQQLARLIEVKSDAERWWPALELLLGRNRWTLIVKEGADYREALEILRKTAPGREPESLLNPAEALQLRGGTIPNSLFSKVDVTHPVAKRYVEHLLGEVLCVKNIEEMESAEAGKAITPEGIFKQAPLRRRLKPANTVELTLGKEGLERMRAAKQKEQQSIRAELEAWKQRVSDVHAWLDVGKKGGLGDSTLPDKASELPRLPQLESDLGRVRETIALLITPEREARQTRLTELETREREILDKVAVLSERKKRFDITILPEREGLERALEDKAAASLEVSASRARLGQQFTGLLDADIRSRRDDFRAQFPKWVDCTNAVLEAAGKAGQIAAEARQKRNNERFRLASDRDEQGHLKHPEYEGEFSHEDESNEAWDARLKVLDTVELEKSRQLAADRKKEWEQRLEDNVLNELNRRITDAQNTIRLLDRYLSQPVGKFRYRISQKKDTAGHGAIWTLLNSGLEATDPLMAGVLDNEVQRAKDDLMRAVNSTEPGDERARRLLDYRNYHHYDLEMVPADKPDAPPISLSRAGRNLSGGESQAPFFISMLAAFRRVYDRGDRASSRSQQLGLVVMDEAFSKLSGDGIEDCLALARSFQLQLVMAFPPERLGVMVPHAQTVVMCQKEIKRNAEGYVTGITNTPLITTMAEAMEALS